jgi:hypothetical protein
MSQIMDISIGSGEFRLRLIVTLSSFHRKLSSTSFSNCSRLKLLIETWLSIDPNARLIEEEWVLEVEEHCL